MGSAHAVDDVVFHDPIRITVSPDGIARVGIAKHLGARRGREVGLAVDLQHPQLAKLAVLEYLHLVHGLGSFRFGKNILNLTMEGFGNGSGPQGMGLFAFTFFNASDSIGRQSCF